MENQKPDNTVKLPSIEIELMEPPTLSAEEIKFAREAALKAFLAKKNERAGVVAETSSMESSDQAAGKKLKLPA
ncbi:hypothetical protein K2173_022919 [Erythroxylum novogranatense]|uniref:Uncharacterized protein n=1 Tax=Erythroxylum novogranatense TaxID=1862640 RepID=A0AAV8T7P9_9ROSI|nr:hypothetical protein K2173_022919 [Erythroxylum novogranatense]